MKCGVDAVHYQKFQRYLLVYLAVSSVLCLCVILPINVSQGSFGKYFSYGTYRSVNNICSIDLVSDGSGGLTL